MPKKAPNWLEYQEQSLGDIPPNQPLLYPIMVGMPKATVFRDRLKSSIVADLRDKANSAMTIRQGRLMEPVFDHYIKFYKKFDDAQGGVVKPSPLDMFGLKHPVVFMYWLQHENWAFSGHKQFDVENDDKSNPTVQQMTTFGNRRGLLVYNGCKVEDRLKYNLYVTVGQTEKVDGEEVYMTTDIIIDPGMNGNSGSTGDGEDGLP